jgi:hypothetical protein
LLSPEFAGRGGDRPAAGDRVSAQPDRADRWDSGEGAVKRSTTLTSLALVLTMCSTEVDANTIPMPIHRNDSEQCKILIQFETMLRPIYKLHFTASAIRDTDVGLEQQRSIAYSNLSENEWQYFAHIISNSSLAELDRQKMYERAVLTRNLDLIIDQELHVQKLVRALSAKEFNEFSKLTENQQAKFKRLCLDPR